MKKCLLALMLLSLMLFVSCDSDDDKDEVRPYDVLLINSGGDFGTISTITDDEITNDVQSVGRWANDALSFENRIYVVNSGTSDIRVYNKESLDPIGAIQLDEGINPMCAAIVNGKIYVTSLFGTGVEVYSISDFSYISTITYPAEVSNGADAIIAKDDYVYVNLNNYYFDANWNSTYDNETIIKIDSSNDTIIGDVEVGVNVGELLFDNEGNLHVLCGGDYADIDGNILKVDVENLTVLDTLSFNFQISCLAKDSYGNIYTAKTDYDLIANSAISEIYKYIASDMSFINNEQNPIMTTTSGVMDLLFYNKRLYVPKFDENKISIFDEEDNLIKEVDTGNGPSKLLGF
ncbi:MAG: hypothetical protein JXR48_13920 [Candidatus Delongbacteria bacterium]|nr:hypothetical protein [Candidatus Delongbacteria bacterium]MBN2836053.1 hypothetical protein [Candidatus Delongbacteria bacterium]